MEAAPVWIINTVSGVRHLGLTLEGVDTVFTSERCNIDQIEFKKIVDVPTTTGGGYRPCEICAKGIGG